MEGVEVGVREEPGLLRACEGGLLARALARVHLTAAMAQGHTPLWTAGVNDQLEVAKTLLKSGAEKEARDKVRAWACGRRAAAVHGLGLMHDACRNDIHTHTFLTSWDVVVMKTVHLTVNPQDGQTLLHWAW